MCKICSKCLINKQLSEFNKNKYSSDGFRAECRICQKFYDNKSINKNRNGINILCNCCNELKEEIYFRKDNNYKCGYGLICKDCINKKYGHKSRDIKHYRKGIIYILESNGIYKIGITIRNILERINDFQTGNPYKINVLKQYISNYIDYDENYLHKTFYKKHFRGEWFNLDKKDLEFIEKYFI